MDTERVNLAVYKNLPEPLVASDIDSIILTGSHAHGTVIDDNDIDVVCVINPISGQALFGFTPFIQKKVSVPSKDSNIDIHYISIRRLIEQLCGCKLSALEILFSPSSLFLKDGEAMHSIQARRTELFLVRNIGPSLMGYAEGQLAAMDHARPNGTNSRRSLALTQHGYDTKAAAHALRALNMCIEFFAYGYFYIDRRGIDARLIKDIKRGEVTLDHFTTIILRYQKQAKMHYERSEGGFPEEVDRAAAEELLIDISIRTTTERYFSWTFSRGFTSGVLPGRSLTQSTAERVVDAAIQKSVDTNVGEKSEDIGVGGVENSTNMAGSGKLDNVGVGKKSLELGVGEKLDHLGAGLESVQIRRGQKSIEITVGQENPVILEGVKSITIR